MKLHRRSLFAIALSLTAAALSPAFAQDRTPFEMKSFQQAQAQGKQILIEVFAPWCPTCRQQNPIISDISKKPAFKNLEIFIVDFDNQKDVVKALRVNRQSTLITFKGAKETGRAVAITSRKEIEDLMRMAL
ncbi:MAG: thioredoxin family protein [Beijerinckiaceae bacterium]|nr:thioredoxin family protein [Beijerinckiaceae bacterium]